MDYLISGLVQAIHLLFSGDEATYSAIRTTLSVSSMSIAASLALGAPLGFLLGHATFPGKRGVRLIVDTLLAFPTVVIGLLVYGLVSSRGPLGHTGLLFTLPGVAIGQTILGLPIIMAMVATAVEETDSRLKPTLRMLGAGRKDVLLTTLVEIRYSVLLACVAAYGRIVSEIGISMMVGGNIKWHTRTITTAIALETGKGEFAMGVALGLVLLGIVFVLNVGLVLLRRRAGR
ncbi:MAG: ABC transporter permease subunit [Deltaproteobacteria bacterium]|nr:ABC transporter permease subunit [Deltaproteobacteria bacterium]